MFAWFYDLVSSRMERLGVGIWRRELLHEIQGDILEIGAGTGRNLIHYGQGVRRLWMLEPDQSMRAGICRKSRGQAISGSVMVLASKAEALPFADNSVDAVVSTLVLCSVENAKNAIHEIKRVLKPGAGFYFLEHVGAFDQERRLSWQRRVDPLWCHLAGGCSLTRDTKSLLRESGLSIESMDMSELPGTGYLVGPAIRGVARKLPLKT